MMMQLEIKNTKDAELKLAKPKDYYAPKQEDDGSKEPKSESQLKQEAANLANKKFYAEISSNQAEGPLDLSMYNSMKVNAKLVYGKAFQKAIVAAILLAAAAYFFVPHKYFYFLEFLRPEYKISIVDEPSDVFVSVQKKLNSNNNKERDLNILSKNYFEEIRCHEFSNIMDEQLKNNFVNKNEMYHFYNCMVQTSTLLMSPNIYTVKKQKLVEKRLNKKTIGYSSLNFAMAEATPKLSTSRYAREKINEACIKWLKSDGCILRMVYEYSRGNIDLVKKRINSLKNKPSDLSKQAMEYWNYLSLMVLIHDPKTKTVGAFNSTDFEGFKVDYIKLRVFEQFAMRFYREGNVDKLKELLKISKIHFNKHMIQRSGKLMTLSFFSSKEGGNLSKLFADNSTLKHFVHDKSLMKLVASVAIRQNKTPDFLAFVKKHHTHSDPIFEKQNTFDKDLWPVRVSASVGSKNRRELFEGITGLQKQEASKKDLEFNVLLGFYNLLISKTDAKFSKNLYSISNSLKKQNGFQKWQSEFVEIVYLISTKKYKAAFKSILNLKKQGYRAEYWAEQAELFLTVFYKESDKLETQHKLVEKKYGPGKVSRYIKTNYLISQEKRLQALQEPRKMIKSWLLQLTFDKHQAPLTGMGLIL